MIYLQLFWEFFKTGLFAIGGGLATLPFLSKISEKYAWFAQEDIGNMLAISESTPGPIGVNMATYAGNTAVVQGGTAAAVLGGFVATLALILPSYIVILIVSKLMKRFSDNKYVQGALKTLRPASVGMIGAAVFSILIANLFHIEMFDIGALGNIFLVPNIILFAIIFALYSKFQKLHPVCFIAIGAIAGIFLKL